MLHLDILVLETFRRIYALEALIDILDRQPNIEWWERQELRDLAEQDEWDSVEYNGQCQILDAKFGQWLPKVAGYSVIILLDSLVETQLLALVQRVVRSKQAKFRAK